MYTHANYKSNKLSSSIAAVEQAWHDDHYLESEKNILKGLVEKLNE